MSEDTEDSNVTKIEKFMRREQHPVPHEAMEQAIKHAHELSGGSPIQAVQAHTDKFRPSFSPEDEDELDLDLRVDDLERRIETLEGRLNGTLFGFIALVVVMVVSITIF